MLPAGVLSIAIMADFGNPTGWAKKRGHRFMTIILSTINRFAIFFTRRFLGKFAVEYVLKLPMRLACVATLPCETLMSAKQAINAKLQGSVAAYLTVTVLDGSRVAHAREKALLGKY